MTWRHALPLLLVACGGAPAHGIADVLISCKGFGDPGVLVLVHETKGDVPDALAANWDVHRCPTRTTPPPVPPFTALASVARRVGSVRLFASFAPGGVTAEESVTPPAPGYGYIARDQRLTCAPPETMMVRITDPDLDIPIASPPPIALTSPSCPGKACGPLDVARPLELRWTPTGGADAYVNVTIDARLPDERSLNRDYFEDCAVPARPAERRSPSARARAERS